jgi:hypothetical protein
MTGFLRRTFGSHNAGYHPPGINRSTPPCASAAWPAAPRLAHSHVTPPTTSPNAPLICPHMGACARLRSVRVPAIVTAQETKQQLKENNVAEAPGYFQSRSGPRGPSLLSDESMLWPKETPLACYRRFFPDASARSLLRLSGRLSSVGNL